MKTSLLAVAVLAVSACGARSDAPFFEGVPTMEGLTLELLGDESEEAGSYYPGGGVGLNTSGIGATNLPEHLTQAQRGIRGVNVAIRRAFLGVHKLLQHEGVRGEGDTRVYGPEDHEGLTYRLTVKRLTRVSFGFKLEAKPTDAGDEAYLALLGGAMSRGAEPHRGRGVLGMNLSRLKTIDPTFAGTGVLVAAFAHRPEGKTVAFRAHDFTADHATYAPVTAAFVGHRRLDNEMRAVRLGMRADVEQVDAENVEQELVGLRARWLPDVGGRAVAVATGGDIPVGQAYLGLSCWDAQASETYKVVKRCLRLEDGTRTECDLLFEAGTAASCRAELGTFDSAPEGGDLSTALEEDAPDGDLEVPQTDPTDG